MKPVSKTLGQVLLDHHRHQTTRRPPGRTPNPDNYTIAYGDLCAAAGVGELTRVVGAFLEEIAEWCADNNYPPLNSLAVNADTWRPGEGYDGAGGFKAIEWALDVKACISSTS